MIYFIEEKRGPWTMVLELGQGSFGTIKAAIEKALSDKEALKDAKVRIVSEIDRNNQFGTMSYKAHTDWFETNQPEKAPWPKETQTQEVQP